MITCGAHDSHEVPWVRCARDVQQHSLLRCLLPEKTGSRNVVTEVLPTQLHLPNLATTPGASGPRSRQAKVYTAAAAERLHTLVKSKCSSSHVEASIGSPFPIDTSLALPLTRAQTSAVVSRARYLSTSPWRMAERFERGTGLSFSPSTQAVEREELPDWTESSAKVLGPSRDATS